MFGGFLHLAVKVFPEGCNCPVALFDSCNGVFEMLSLSSSSSSSSPQLFQSALWWCGCFIHCGNTGIPCFLNCIMWCMFPLEEVESVCVWWKHTGNQLQWSTKWCNKCYLRFCLFSSKPKPASQSQLLMESWLKKGTVKRESDRQINESTMSLSSEDGNSSIMKKVKVEENSEALWDSYVSTQMVLHDWVWVVMQMILMCTSIWIADTFVGNVTHWMSGIVRDQHMFVQQCTIYRSRWQAVEEVCCYSQTESNNF